MRCWQDQLPFHAGGACSHRTSHRPYLRLHLRRKITLVCSLFQFSPIYSADNGTTRRQKRMHGSPLNCTCTRAYIVQFAGGRGRGRGGGGGSRGYKGGSRYGPRPDYPEVEKRNAAFERYYNELAVVGEDEREEFWTALRRELPNSFRFAGSKG